MALRQFPLTNVGRLNGNDGTRKRTDAGIRRVTAAIRAYRQRQTTGITIREGESNTASVSNAESTQTEIVVGEEKPEGKQNGKKPKLGPQEHWISLPIPPSVNHKFVGHYVLSPASREFYQNVQATCMSMKMRPIDGDVFVKIRIYRARKAGDIDGRLKMVLDSLQAKDGFGCYHNDAQVKELNVSLDDTDPKKPRVVVMVKALGFS